MNHFIYTYIISLLTGRYELNKMTSLPMCGFIAQLVEHRTGIAEVTGSNPVEALIFFRLLLSSCLNWKIHCEDHSSLSSMTAVQIYELFHIYLHQSFLCWSNYRVWTRARNVSLKPGRNRSLLSVLSARRFADIKNRKIVIPLRQRKILPCGSW